MSFFRSIQFKFCSHLIVSWSSNRWYYWILIIFNLDPNYASQKAAVGRKPKSIRWWRRKKNLGKKVQSQLNKHGVILLRIHHTGITWEGEIVVHLYWIDGLIKLKSLHVNTSIIWAWSEWNSHYIERGDVDLKLSNQQDKIEHAWLSS